MAICMITTKQEDLMIEVFLSICSQKSHASGTAVLRLTCIKQRGTWLCAIKADIGFSSASMT